MTTRKAPHNVIVPLVLGATMVFILPALILYPFHSDIDIQQVMGFALYRDHRLPYLGSWDSNFPGTIWLHAAAIALFGRSELGLRMFDLVFECAIIIALYRFGRYWLAKGPALLGSVLFALFYVNGPAQYISQRDCFAVLPLLLGTGVAIKAYRSQRLTNFWIFISGALLAVGFWIRPTFALLAVVPALTLFDIRTVRGRYAIAFEIVGFLFVLLLGLVPYGFRLSAIKEIYLATIQYNAEIYSHTFTIKDYSRRAWVAVGFIAAWFITIWSHKRNRLEFDLQNPDRREFRFIFGSLVALLIGIAVMRRFASYHFAPFFAMIMPVVAAVLWDWLVTRRGSKMPIIVAMMIAILVLYPWGLIWSSLRNGIDNQGSADVRAVTQYIEGHSATNDPIEVASFFPVVRWRIDRPFVTRFTTPQPLFTLAPDGQLKNYQQLWRTEYVREIERLRPKYVVFENYIDPATRLSTESLFLSIDGFAPMLATIYYPDTTIGKFHLYVRKQIEE